MRIQYHNAGPTVNFGFGATLNAIRNYSGPIRCTLAPCLDRAYRRSLADCAVLMIESREIHS